MAPIFLEKNAKTDSWRRKYDH